MDEQYLTAAEIRFLELMNRASPDVIEEVLRILKGTEKEASE